MKRILKAVMGRLARQCEMHALTDHCSERVCLHEKASTLPIADNLKRECFSQLALSLSLLMSFACAHSRIVSLSQPVVRTASLSVANARVRFLHNTMRFTSSAARIARPVDKCRPVYQQSADVACTPIVMKPEPKKGRDERWWKVQGGRRRGSKGSRRDDDKHSKMSPRSQVAVSKGWRGISFRMSVSLVSFTLYEDVRPPPPPPRRGSKGSRRDDRRKGWKGISF